MSVDYGNRATSLVELTDYARTSPAMFGPQRPITTERLARAVAAAGVIVEEHSLVSALGYSPAGYDDLARAYRAAKELRETAYYGLSFDWEG